MAKTGPRPKPKAALIRSGSNQIYNRKDDLEVPVGMPDMPGWLDKTAKDIWGEVVKQLFNLGVISKIDKGILGLYCHAFSEFLQINKQCKDYVITTQTGAIKRNPLLKAKSDAWERVLKISKELGLTPAARAGLAPVAGKREAKKSSSRFFTGQAS